MHTHDAHDNHPTESLSPTSPPVRVIAFSHPHQYMMGVVVLETAMSVLYTLTPCDPKTFCFNSWPSCTLYDHSCSFPRTPPDISHRGRCAQGIQKKTGQFVSDLQICCHFTTHNSATALKTNGETNTFLICLFVLFPQLDLSLIT